MNVRLPENITKKCCSFSTQSYVRYKIKSK